MGAVYSVRRAEKRCANGVALILVGDIPERKNHLPVSYDQEHRDPDFFGVRADTLWCRFAMIVC